MKERENEGLKGLVEECLRRRELREDDGGRVRGGNDDVVLEVELGKCGVEGEKGGEEERGGGRDGGENFVGDGDGGDAGGGVVCGDVFADPGNGGGVGGSNSNDLVVGDADGDVDVGAGEGGEDVGVGVVETDVSYFLLLEEVDELGGW